MTRPAADGPPFVVLHVCMGNICRSPMAERMLAHAVRRRLGAAGEASVHTESAGTGSWHVGEPMNPPAARELGRRGVDHDAFRARKLIGAHLDTADLVLTATGEQLHYIAGLRPDALPRTFVLGEFGRLARRVDPAALPPAEGTAAGVHVRGVALVAAADAARAGEHPRPGDDLDDPWGRDPSYFTMTADQIGTAVDALVDLLLPA